METKLADGRIVIDLTPQDDGVEVALAHRIVLESNQIRLLLGALTGAAGKDGDRPMPSPRSKPAKAGEPWSDESDRELVDLVSIGWTVADLATHFGRTTGAITSRIMRLTARGLIPIVTVAPHE